MSSNQRPAGWPASVPPPGAAGWRRKAAGWLFDHCPGGYRDHDLLARYPAVLARLTVIHLSGLQGSSRQALAGLRAELADEVPAQVITAALAVVETEQARGAAALRAARLIGEALARGEFAER